MSFAQVTDNGRLADVQYEIRETQVANDGFSQEQTVVEIRATTEMRTKSPDVDAESFTAASSPNRKTSCGDLHIDLLKIPGSAKQHFCAMRYSQMVQKKKKRDAVHWRIR